MRKITKSKRPVRIPYSASSRAGECKLENSTEELKTKFLSNRSAYNKGRKKFTFYEAIYGHSLIRNSILTSQRRKCCYCEKSIVDDETVEHFRPKKGFQQGRGEKVIFPGYYWLAYDWRNLLYACNKCNMTKGNLFPLISPLNRVRNHLSNPSCSIEDPAIVNPANENPTQYFRFVGASVRPVVSRTRRKRIKAQTTIDVIGLNRQGLIERRAELHTLLNVTRDAFLKQYPVSKARMEFRKHLKTKVKKEQEFSMMVKNVFSKELR